MFVVLLVFGLLLRWWADQPSSHRQGIFIGYLQTREVETNFLLGLCHPPTWWRS